MRSDLFIFTVFALSIRSIRTQESYDYNFDPDESYDPGEPQDPTTNESQDSDSQDSDSYSNYSELAQSSESDDYDYTGSSGDENFVSTMSPEDSLNGIIDSFSGNTTTASPEDPLFGDKFIQIAICVGTVFGVTLAVIFVYFIVRTVQSDDKKCETVLNEYTSGDPENQAPTSSDDPENGSSEEGAEDPLLQKSNDNPSKNPFGESKEDLLEP
ncbi:unnamed protein product [Oikopleura dioica]|uniref:Syndecan/Neurexin domain-containing protein n=1 Tax=Oikopleura dioica TaxID=34765 RepID=E4WVG9_OIKDI|nr:unnamed protein product [Oikopleura dioica]